MTGHYQFCRHEEYYVEGEEVTIKCDCDLIAKVRADERERLARVWNEEGHGVRFNHAHDDLTPHQRVLKWLRGQA